MMIEDYNTNHKIGDLIALNSNLSWSYDNMNNKHIVYKRLNSGTIGVILNIEECYGFVLLNNECKWIRLKFLDIV